eukprot:TRINITY_DN16629_c0_g2_i1.p1 TRINITY_DN16629_c0_g2~~TRINITY_DN16629_c0_g2_i1.p1  ORF type:complete len:288 (+),score=24.15 TRINITY_DN16629_c0_g2_i1:40-903(+)
MFRKVGIAVVGATSVFGTSVFADTLRAPYEPQKALDPKNFKQFPVILTGKYNHDTAKIAVHIGNNCVPGMKASFIVVIRGKDAEGKTVIRPYTPITRAQQKGTMEFLIKKYPGGKMGTYIHDLHIGDTLDIKGPFMKTPIKSNEHKHVGLLCGGTGITPMYQILHALLDDPSDKTKITLVYANKTPADILLKTELQIMERAHKRLRVIHVLEDAPFNWDHALGFVNSHIIKNYMPKPSEGKIYVCGPPGMMKAISGDKDYESSPPKQGPLAGLLKDLSYTSDDVFKF